MKKGIITTLVFVSIIFANEWKQVKSLNPDDNYEVIRVETSVDNLNFTVMRGLWQTVVISTDFVDMRGFIIIVSANTTDTIPVFVADHKNGRCSYVPKEMTKIQVLQAEGAQTPAEIRALAQSYNALAKEMGATTIEVASGSVEWLRQGKTIAETTELLKSSVMLSKLGALDAANATEYLTSTMNSYNMSTSQSVEVVNKLVAVDNKSATSTRELATALRYSAASAQEAGVSLEELISYIAVVSSTTRQNAESIGQGFKTLLTRMQDIKAGAIDEDGLGINNVEIALDRVNIKLRDSDTSFRDMGVVLEEIAGKWNTLNEVEQANISKAIAGKENARTYGNIGTFI